MKRTVGQFVLRVTMVLIVLSCFRAHAQRPNAVAAAPVVPPRYVLQYPAATRCCPPIASAFGDASRSFSVVRGRRFTHKPNGGYGLPVVAKQNGRNLLHVGADLGWYQVGATVYAIANGVVRFSDGPNPKRDPKKRERVSPGTMSWGNFVIIEHRFGDAYFTSIYGHLSPERLVNVGDVVTAGQPIGSIGRKSPRINGGYNPHLHFGVREGRNVEPGMVLAKFANPNGIHSITLAKLDEKEVELRLPDGIRLPETVKVNGRPFKTEFRDGKTFAPSEVLWGTMRPSFPLVGYALTTDGWRDPIRFLRAYQADRNPAPFQKRKRRKRR